MCAVLTIVFADALLELGVLRRVKNGLRPRRQHDGGRRFCSDRLALGAGLSTPCLLFLCSPEWSTLDRLVSVKESEHSPVLEPDLGLALSHTQLLADLLAADGIGTTVGSEYGFQDGQLLGVDTATLRLLFDGCSSGLRRYLGGVSRDAAG